MQNKIPYHEIMKLGFTEEICPDTVYFDTYGYQYAIIELQLDKRISLHWAKETQLCEMIRVDSPKHNNILKRRPINTLEELKSWIDFYKVDNTTEEPEGYFA